MKKILAATGCPTGIAHTYMAEEALKSAVQKAGVDIKKLQKHIILKAYLI